MGTPGRVLALVREGAHIYPHNPMLGHYSNYSKGALKLDGVAAIVLDMSVVNEKQQGIFDIRETQKDVLDLLNEPVIKARLGEQIKVLVF